MNTRILVFLLSISCLACSSPRDLSWIINSAIEHKADEVLIPPGHYVLNEPIELNLLEHFSIRAKKQGTVTITSGLELSLEDFLCIDAEKGIYEICLPELISIPWPDAFRGYAGWPEVSVNGVPLELARAPNTGFLKIDSIIHPGSNPREGDSTNQGAVFISHELAGELSTSNYQNLYLSGFWRYQWYDETLRVDSMDLKTGFVHLAAPHNYSVGDPTGGLFYAINQLEFLDQPGEYFVEPESGTIRFMLPQPTDEEVLVNIGYQDFPLLNLADCSNVVIENLSFSDHNGWVINIENSDSVQIRGCMINRLAQSAIRITGGHHCGVDDTEISQIGGTGIRLKGGDRSSLEAGDHYVRNCSISSFARHILTYSPAVLLEGVGHQVTNNQISDAPHNAILFSGNDHLIENNQIKRVCLNTSDAGAIYCGRDWAMGGNIIRGNFISNLGSASHHFNWAIYLDDLASGIEVSNNIIDNCHSGILVGGGRYNRIFGNRITNCDRASIMYDARGLGWASFFVQDPKNIMWERLEEIPIANPPWSKRFPWLMELRNDDPAIPKHVEIVNNEIIQSAKPDIHPTVIQYGNVQLN